MSENLNQQAPVISENNIGPSPDRILADIIEATKAEAVGVKTAADTVKADVAVIKAAGDAAGESQKQIALVLAESQKRLSEISTIATQAVAANAKITDNQAVVATKSDHIQQAQEHADKVRADLDRALTATKQQVTEVEGEKAKVQSLSEKTANLLTAIQTAKGTVDTAAAAVTATQKAAETAAALTKSLADKSTTVEQRIADYEKRLTEIDKRCAEQLDTINELLRGATSAGLATAFDQRRQTFLKPNSRWQWLFIGSVLFLVGLTVSGLVHVYNLEKVPEWGELARVWLARLPIAGALIWLALHASREAALAKRLEEDYGYKAAIASCFEGFRKQMSEIDTGNAPQSQLAKLCENTLATIASPPGRIYDAHKLVVSPTDEITDAAKAAVNVVNSVKS